MCLHLHCGEGAFCSAPQSPWVHLSGGSTAVLSFPSVWVYCPQKQEWVGKWHLSRPYHDNFNTDKAPTANSCEGFLIPRFRYMWPNLINFILSFSSAFQRPESGHSKLPAVHLGSWGAQLNTWIHWAHWKAWVKNKGGDQALGYTQSCFLM